MTEPNPLETVEYEVSPVAGFKSGDALGNLHVIVEAGGCSHPGKIRDCNEDHFMICRIRRQMDLLSTNVPEEDVPRHAEWDGYILAVADGLGGHSAGERASQLALKKGLDLVLAQANWALMLNDEEESRLIARMREYFSEIDKCLNQEVEIDPALKGMATTLTVAYTVGLRAFLLHVGDSRIYRLRSGRLEQLTRDHTVAQGMLDAGQITADQLRHHARRHVLTNVLSGRPGDVVPDISSFQLQHGDRLLLCSDGLNEMLPDDAIATILLQHPDPDDAANALVQEANNRGGRDNITAVVANYTVEAPGMKT